MSRRDIWLYDPEICDGDLCIQNCDHCPKADKVMDKVIQKQEESNDSNRD